jgi:hypothetical protein
MADYRAYIIGTDGHFIRVEYLSPHADDVSAIEAAKQLVDGHDVELWERERLITRLKRKTARDEP